MCSHHLQVYLREMKISQAAAARRAHVHPARFSEVFSGRKENFSRQDIARLAAAFPDFPLAKLMFGRGEPPAANRSTPTKPVPLPKRLPGARIT
jgi:hypothetical protein